MAPPTTTTEEDCRTLLALLADARREAKRVSNARFHWCDEVERRERRGTKNSKLPSQSCVTSSAVFHPATASTRPSVPEGAAGNLQSASSRKRAFPILEKSGQDADDYASTTAMLRDMVLRQESSSILHSSAAEEGAPRLAQFGADPEFEGDPGHRDDDADKRPDAGAARGFQTRIVGAAEAPPAEDLPVRHFLVPEDQEGDTSPLFVGFNAQGSGGDQEHPDETYRDSRLFHSSLRESFDGPRFDSDLQESLVDLSTLRRAAAEARAATVNAAEARGGRGSYSSYSREDSRQIQDTLAALSWGERSLVEDRAQETQVAHRTNHAIGAPQHRPRPKTASYLQSKVSLGGSNNLSHFADILAEHGATRWRN